MGGPSVCKALAITYFLTGNPQYHRRGVVSRSCSGWEGVGPTRYGRQEFGVVVALVGNHALVGNGDEGLGLLHCLGAARRAQVLNAPLYAEL